MPDLRKNLKKIALWAIGPLSIAHTRTCRRASTQLQPPGAAPRSAALMPGQGSSMK